MHARQYIFCPSGHHQRRRRVQEHNVAVGGFFARQQRCQPRRIFPRPAAFQVGQFRAGQAGIFGRNLAAQDTPAIQHSGGGDIGGGHFVQPVPAMHNHGA